MTIEWLFSIHLALHLWGWDAGQVLTRKWTQDAVSSLKDETTQERNQNEDDSESEPDFAVMQTLPMYGWVHISLILPMTSLYFILMVVLGVPMYTEDPGLMTSVCKTFALSPTALLKWKFQLKCPLREVFLRDFFLCFYPATFHQRILSYFLPCCWLSEVNHIPSMCMTCLQSSVFHINEYWMVSRRYFIELCPWYLQGFFLT